MIEIPSDISGITAAWLGHALRASPRLADAQAVACSVTRIGVDMGFASQVFRAQVQWQPADPRRPASLVVKLAAADAAQPPERLARKYRREARFYRELAARPGVPVPECHAVLWQAEPPRLALVLEDLEGAVFGDVERGGEAAQFAAAVDGLARLHARWWQHPALDALDWLEPYGRVRAQLTRLPERRPVFLERFGHLLDENAVALTRRIGPDWEPRLARVAGPPATLLHVDAHLDNFAFRPAADGLEAVLFDWQGTARGLCTVDLALLLAALEPEQRRTEEGALLDRYHAELIAGGVSGYARGVLAADYRIALVRLWIGYVNGFGSPQAGTWSGRQAALVRLELQRMCAALRMQKPGQA